MTQDFVNFGEIFFAFVLLEMTGISQGFKTFWVYLKTLLENYFKLSIIFLKNFLEEDQVPKYYFPSFFQTYASYLHRIPPKMILLSQRFALQNVV
jgi:hypothetical protein